MLNDDEIEEPREAGTVEDKIFLKHEPTGLVVHRTIISEYGKAGVRLTNMIDWLVTHDFGPHEGWGSSMPGKAVGIAEPPVTRETVSSAPLCSKCNATLELREGATNGKPWKGFFCKNSTKEDRHPVEWV